MIEWTFKGEVFQDVGCHQGFVYLITNLQSGKRYIGKKNFYQSKTFIVNKKKKKKQVESNWKTYYGSNDDLNNDIKEIGKDNFKREILYLCISKSEMNYLEAREQFTRNVLLDDSYYNYWIMVRIHQKNLSKLKHDHESFIKRS